MPEERADMSCASSWGVHAPEEGRRETGGGVGRESGACC